MSHRSRSTRHLGLIVTTVTALVVLALSSVVGPAGQGATPVAASDASAISSQAPAQAEGCVTAMNLDHALRNRAWSIVLFVWARGSNNYLGLLFDSTSLREGPTGTWTKVDSCGPGTTTTSVPGTTTTMPTTTTTMPTTTTTVPGTTTTTGPAPDGAAIFAANCAGCHGADGSGGVGPSLQGIGEMHTVDQLIEVITNGRNEMPAWQDRLTPEQIRAVAEFVSTIPGTHEHDHDAA